MTVRACRDEVGEDNVEAIYGLSAGFDQVVGLLRSIRTRAASLAGTSRTSIPSVRNRVVHGRKNDDADAVSVAIAERDCRVASAAFDGPPLPYAQSSNTAHHRVKMRTQDQDCPWH